MLKKHNKKTKLSLQLFLIANLYRVNEPIDMRVGKDANLNIHIKEIKVGFFFQVKQQLMKMDLLHRLKQFYQMYQRIRTEGLAKINFFFNLVLSLFD